MLALIIASLLTSFIISFLIFSYIHFPTRVKKCPSDERMDGKVIIVTGANSGLGFETAKEMARRGGRVILACRNEGRGLAAQDAIRKETGNQDVVYRNLDLSSLDSIRKFAEVINSTEPKLHVLVNNAGGYAYPDQLTEDGIVQIMQINYFGAFLLSLLLLPLLRKSPPSRIVNVNSLLHLLGVIDFENLNKVQKYSNIRSYSNSKLCGLLFTVELARRLEGTGVTVNALHPGIINTHILDNASMGFWEVGFIVVSKIVKTTAEVGAQTIIHLAVSKEFEVVSGKYYADCQPALTHYLSKNRSKAMELWKLSEKLVKQKSDI